MLAQARVAAICTTTGSASLEVLSLEILRHFLKTIILELLLDHEHVKDHIC
jgi:hypothetical protein